jgi:5-dehydro-4-deoxyglucarate dehydratase
MALSPRELSHRIRGLLGFPITPFGPGGDINMPVFTEQVDLLLRYGAQAVFPACGTGELQSLTADEHRRLIATCVEHVAGRVPVVAGVGFGVATAVDLATNAQVAGVDAVLVFPPYLAAADSTLQESYYRRIAESLSIGVIVYQRDNAIFTPDSLARLAAVENIVGLKDGLGRVDLLQQQRAAVDDEQFMFLNGLPTAELFAPALRACGITSYSSALLNCAPEAASEFYRAWSSGDEAATAALMRSLILPFVRLRDRVPGYAVSLIKAAAQLRGIDAGPARAPLPEPTEADLRDLRELFAGLGLTGELAAASAAAVPNR